MRTQHIAFTILLIPAMSQATQQLDLPSLFAQPSTAPLPLVDVRDPHLQLRLAQLAEQRGYHREAAHRYSVAVAGLRDKHGAEHPIVQSAVASQRLLLMKMRPR